MQAFGVKATAGEPVVCLHGFPSDSSAWEPWFLPLTKAGHRVVAIDQPGFGSSPGLRFNARSEAVMQAGGPGAVVEDVMAFFELGPSILLGNDWGGGISFALAMSRPHLVSRVIVQHASYTQQQKRPGELASIKVPTLILWREGGDQFHPVAWAKSFHSAIKSSQLVLLPKDSAGASAAVGAALAWLTSPTARPRERKVLAAFFGAKTQPPREYGSGSPSPTPSGGGGGEGAAAPDEDRAAATTGDGDGEASAPVSLPGTVGSAGSSSVDSATSAGSEGQP